MFGKSIDWVRILAYAAGNAGGEYFCREPLLNVVWYRKSPNRPRKSPRNLLTLHMGVHRIAVRLARAKEVRGYV